MVIGFYSPEHLNTTPSLMAIASHSVLRDEKKVLIINATNNEYELEKSFGISDEGLLYEVGIDFLFRSLKVDKLTREVIENAAFSFYNNKLHLLTASKRIINVFREDVQKELVTIITTAREYYDIVLVNLDSTATMETWESLINCCDKVVLNLSQNKRKMDKYVSVTELKRDKFIYYIDRYDDKSVYNIKNLSRKLPHKIAGIPYDTSYYDSLYRGDVIEYMEKENMNSSRVWFSFLDKVETTCKIILEGKEVK